LMASCMPSSTCSCFCTSPLVFSACALSCGISSCSRWMSASSVCGASRQAGGGQCRPAASLVSGRRPGPTPAPQLRAAAARCQPAARAHLDGLLVVGQLAGDLLELGLEVLQVGAHLDVLALKLLEALLRLLQRLLHLGHLRLGALQRKGAARAASA
jgi:hypothetical protein